MSLRADFLNTILAILATPLRVEPAAPMKSIAGLAVPDSKLANEATAVASASLPVEIYRHSLRTYLFAEAIAKTTNVDHDVEALYVASILHDVGLSPTYMSESNRFEVDGANAAREFLRKRGITGLRADLVWDAIGLHDSSLAKWKQPEVRLVNQGVNADFGAYQDVLSKESIVAILREAPRDGFVPVFLNAVAVIGKKKPHATGTCFVTDVAYRMVPGFHLENFCDEVATDPFASYTKTP
jgi:hypothetical protein